MRQRGYAHTRTNAGSRWLIGALDQGPPSIATVDFESGFYLRIPTVDFCSGPPYVHNDSYCVHMVPAIIRYYSSVSTSFILTCTQVPVHTVDISRELPWPVRHPLSRPGNTDKTIDKINVQVKRPALLNGTYRVIQDKES